MLAAVQSRTLHAAILASTCDVGDMAGADMDSHVGEAIGVRPLRRLLSPDEYNSTGTEDAMFSAELVWPKYSTDIEAADTIKNWCMSLGAWVHCYNDGNENCVIVTRGYDKRYTGRASSYPEAMCRAFLAMVAEIRDKWGTSDIRRP